MTDQLKADLTEAIEAATGVKGWQQKYIEDVQDGEYYEFTAPYSDKQTQVFYVNIENYYDIAREIEWEENGALPFDAGKYVDFLRSKGY